MKIQFDHPTIQVDQPAEGQFVITGLRSGMVQVEGGNLVTPPTCHITPEVPTDLLLQILAARGDISAEPPERDVEELAGELYSTYCEAVGGKAFNGDPLPTWEEFRADEKKQPQSDAWVAVAMASMGVETGGPDEEEDEDAADDSATAAGEPRQKRKRRTKAQMKADAANAATK